MMDDGARKRNIENLQKLAQTISSNFNFKQKSTLFWADIYQAVKQSSSNTFVEEKEARGQLNELVKIMQSWITLTSLPGKTLIK
jgi:DNA replication factor Cdt1 C-terminal domain